MTRNIFVYGLLAVLALVSCSPQQPQQQTTSVTTEPSVTDTPFQFPTYAYVTRTEAPQVATAAAATAAAATQRASEGSLDPVAVERGLGRYEALECGTCHGAKGEGVEDKGPALAGTTLSEKDFIAFLRSGGTIGVSHQYATNRLSESGGKNLYQYILSLAAE